MCALRSASPGRVDGLAKVKGTAIYGDDITLPDMLYGVCRYADIPAGKVEELDLNRGRSQDCDLAGYSRHAGGRRYR